MQEHRARLERFRESRYTHFPNLSSHPAYQTYATVEVDGQVVATIDNHGFAQSSNALGSRLGGLLPDDVYGRTGPVLAQKRAEIIAQVLGGKVVKAPSALTQAAFERLPEPTGVIDYAALRADPLYQSLQKEKQAETAFNAQQIAQDAADDEAATAATASVEIDNESSAVKAFLDYMARSPEERYFEAFLKARGLTAEDYAALSPKEQQGLLEEFKETLKHRMGAASAERIARAARRGWL